MDGATPAKYPRLNQVLAVEIGVKERVNKVITEIYHLAQKPALFNGFVKKYKPINEQSEVYPEQRVKVQANAEDGLKAVIAGKVELADVIMQKDIANTFAKADIIVDGTVLFSDAPATFILWFEKQVEDLRTYVTALPTLDVGEDWTPDVNTGLYKSEESQTHRTQKVQEPIVLYPATDKHPAQTQLLTKDVLVGFWDEVKVSGALPVPRKQAILERIEKLYRAVKTAREAANMAEAPAVRVGEALYGTLLG